MQRIIKRSKLVLNLAKRGAATSTTLSKALSYSNKAPNLINTKFA